MASHAGPHDFTFVDILTVFAVFARVSRMTGACWFETNIIQAIRVLTTERLFKRTFVDVNAVKEFFIFIFLVKLIALASVTSRCIFTV